MLATFCDKVIATIHQNSHQERIQKKVQNGQQQDVQWKEHLKLCQRGGTPPSHSISSADPFPLQNKGKNGMKIKSPSTYYWPTDWYTALELSMDQSDTFCGGTTSHQKWTKEIPLYFYRT